MACKENYFCHIYWTAAMLSLYGRAEQEVGGVKRQSMSFNPLWQRAPQHHHVQLEFRTTKREEKGPQGVH